MPPDKHTINQTDLQGIHWGLRDYIIKLHSVTYIVVTRCYELIFDNRKIQSCMTISAEALKEITMDAIVKQIIEFYGCKEGFSAAPGIRIQLLPNKKPKIARRRKIRI